MFTEEHTNKLWKGKMINHISNVNIWLKMNKLKLNEIKTNLMQINTNSESVLDINSQGIEKVDTIKYLGFVLNKKQKFNEHVEYICKKNIP